MRKVDYHTWLRNGVFGVTIYCFKCMKSDCTLKEHEHFREKLNYRIRITKVNSSHYKKKKFLSYLFTYPYYKKGYERVQKGLSFKEIE